MTDIGSLSSEIQKLETLYNISNKFIICFIAATAIVAALYFVSAYINSNIGSRLNRAKDELAQLKESQSSEKIAALNAEAERAREERAKADLKIEEARADAAKANGQAQNAIAVAATARAETAEAVKEQEQLKKINLELSLQVEKERVARLQLEERIAPRKFTAQQRSQLITSLEANRGPITITVPSNDVEAWNFAQIIAEALLASGWTVQGVNQAALVNIPPGLTLVMHSAAAQPPNAGLLQRALNAIGFATQGVTDQNVQTGTMLLLVGSKQ